MLLLPWSSQCGGNTISWETEVAINIHGFPPHTFNPSVLEPLLSRHCSIQAYSFSEARSACRVDAYALNAESIPSSGQIGVQYPHVSGVSNVVFSVTMTTYPYNEAPAFQKDDSAAGLAHYSLARSVASFDTAEEFGYDREVLQEAYECQHRANQELERARYRGIVTYSSSSSYGASSEEPFYLLRDCSPVRSFESDRSWKLY